MTTSSRDDSIRDPTTAVRAPVRSPRRQIDERPAAPLNGGHDETPHSAPGRGPARGVHRNSDRTRPDHFGHYYVRRGHEPDDHHGRDSEQSAGFRLHHNRRAVSVV